MTTPNLHSYSITVKLYKILSRVATGGYVAYKAMRSKQEVGFWKSRLWETTCTFNLPYPRVVLHGASVGEVTGIIPVVNRLEGEGFPGVVIVSIGTPAGYQRAKALMGNYATIVPAPFDTNMAVIRFLQAIEPSVYVSFEAEYWPVLFEHLKRQSIPALLCNGRVSTGSFRLYQLGGKLFRPIFSYFSRMGMVSLNDQLRAVALGANPERAEVTGSTKYEHLKNWVTRRDEVVEKWRNVLCLNPDELVLVAGSLRGKECRIFAELSRSLMREFPSILCILAPRHSHRVLELQKLLSMEGEKVVRLSAYLDTSSSNKMRWQTSGQKIIIVDTVGHLFELYALATVVFCGGTLEPVGGHNIVEPVVWGRRVVFGSHVAKVAQEAQLLEKSRAGVRVDCVSELTSTIKDILRTPEEGIIDNETIQTVLRSLSGASESCVKWIKDILSRGEWYEKA